MRLKQRIEKLEEMTGVDEDDLSSLSNEELENRLRSLYQKKGIDPTLPLDEMIRIFKENMKNESLT